MTHTTKSALLAALLIPGMAFAQINVGDVLGTEETAIAAALEAQGYVIEEVEVEGDEIEFEVTLDGQELEIEVSMATGAVTEVEVEDDDDDDDNDEDDDDDK